MLTKRGKRLSRSRCCSGLGCDHDPRTGAVAGRGRPPIPGRPIPDIELKRLLAYMMPGSGQWLRPLVETHNPYAVIRNVRTTPADIQAGATLFRSQCADATPRTERWPRSV